MKGMVFTMLNDLVEAQFGISVWDDLIDATKPASEGIYTSVETYPDSELLAYVKVLSARTGIDQAALVRAFGGFVLNKFYEMHPEFFEHHDAKTFLKSVHDVIHVEVKKLHPDVVLPEFQYEDPGAGRLVMHYFSPRQLCHLAEGLIDGTATRFGTTISVDHGVCTHSGADHCVLNLSFGEARAVVAG